MKIINLEIENIKRIRAANITPHGNMVVIGGDNGAGKSTVLDAIMHAIVGNKNLPSKLITEGESKGQIIVNIGKFVITKKFRKQGDKETAILEVTNAEGFKVSSPQALLDSLYGEMTFDPLEFSRLKEKDQVNQLKELLGIDFTELDKRRQEAYAERTVVKREADKLEASLAQNLITDNLPESEINVSDLLNKLSEIQKKNQGNQKLKLDLGHTLELGKKSKELIDSLRKSLEEETENYEKLKQDYLIKKEMVSKLIDEDESIIKEQIQKSDITNSQIRKNKQNLETRSELHNVSNKVSQLTQEINNIDQKKLTMTQAAKFPVSGLGFGENGLSFNGLPFQNSSTAEKLRISVAMGIALNPKLNIMQIRDGSLLDERSLELINQMAIESDMQIFIERVSKGKECSIIIEDGSIKE